MCASPHHLEGFCVHVRYVQYHSTAARRLTGDGRPRTVTPASLMQQASLATRSQGGGGVEGMSADEPAPRDEGFLINLNRHNDVTSSKINYCLGISNGHGIQFFPPLLFTRFSAAPHLPITVPSIFATRKPLHRTKTEYGCGGIRPETDHGNGGSPIRRSGSAALRLASICASPYLAASIIAAMARTGTLPWRRAESRDDRRPLTPAPGALAPALS